MKPVTRIAAVLFGLIAILQAARVAMGWEVMVSGHVVPIWPSYIAVAVTATLAVLLWREGRCGGAPVGR
jgi:hypothetical protein